MERLFISLYNNVFDIEKNEYNFSKKEKIFLLGIETKKKITIMTK